MTDKNALTDNERAALHTEFPSPVARAVAHQPPATDDFEAMLRQVVHGLRQAVDPKVISLRDRADDLLRRKGRASPLREAAPQPPAQAGNRVVDYDLLGKPITADQVAATSKPLAPMVGRPEAVVKAEALRAIVPAIYGTPGYVSSMTPDDRGMLPPGSPYDRGRWEAARIILAEADRLERGCAS